MDMTVAIDKLKELQDILSAKYDLEMKISESPKRLSNQKELVARLKKEFIEKNTRYDEVKKTVGLLKVDLAAADAARERGEKGMDSITTHREYEALEKEIKEATEKEQQIRKELQREEKILADLDEELKQDEILIQSQEEELNAGNTSLNEEIAEYNKELEELNAKEAEITPSIDPEIVFKFKRIIKSKQSKAIVAVKGNVCDGCHMILPAQFANKVHTGEDYVFCPYCSRILYFQELENGESEYFQIDDSESLLDDDYHDEDEEDEDEDMEDESYSKSINFEE